MVETHVENRNKQPGLPDLPSKRQKAVDAKLPADDNDAPTGRMKAGAVKKPGGQKAAKEQKACAAGKVAQLEIYMEMEDVEKERLAVRQPSPTINKVSQKPSTGIWSASPPNSDSIKHPPHNTVKSSGFEDEREDDEECQASPRAQLPMPIITHGDNDILALSMVSVSKSVSPVNRIPVAMGEEQEGNTLDNDLLFPNLEPDQTSAESENEVDGASAVDIDNAKSKCECKADPSIKAYTVNTDNAKTKCEFKAQSKANRNTGEEGEQTVNTTFEDSDDEDITHRRVKTKPSHKNTSTHIDRESGSSSKSKTRVNATTEDSDDEEIMHRPMKTKPSYENTSTCVDQETSSSSRSKTRVKTTPEDSDNELMHPLMNTKKFHKNISTHVDQETTDKSNKSKTRVDMTVESDDEELVRRPMNAKPSHNVRKSKSKVSSKKHRPIQCNSDSEDDDNDDNDDDAEFDSYVVPMWIDFISCLDNMWDISDFAEEMQQIWDHAFPTLKHTVLKNKDAVYKVLMQRAYDYRRNFIAYLVPEQARYVDDAGCTAWVNPPIYPYMWKLVVRDRTDIDSYRGSFKDSCILDTFTLYLEQVHDLPKELRRTDMPKGALSIATIVVKQAWKMWSTGVYVKPKRPVESQFAEGLWSDRTKLVIESLEQASRRKWKKIFKGVRPFIDAHRKQPSRHAKAQRKADLTFHLWVDFF
ncbi:hypothetical protein DFJ58DRAFT_736134 [Suillus subalutaceus]|uniref:uncharacterized protein n=1 Tax=Suillus subalutaceus TaxID=48586 RepID=UPI001B8871B2|nr:uncharacterized protein DFJ58DRAFT_736134 [Suillus subalutaceus]KAG1833245.1 hypothetical protein DFJ58DRAFT_736134 [Suillus subalutaceus]